MVNSRLGPGTWMNRIDATTNAISWLVVGTAQCGPGVGTLSPPFR
jgi:hypothetical protein